MQYKIHGQVLKCHLIKCILRDSRKIILNYESNTLNDVGQNYAHHKSNFVT
jgi:hypothetical protein